MSNKNFIAKLQKDVAREYEKRKKEANVGEPMVNFSVEAVLLDADLRNPFGLSEKLVRAFSEAFSTCEKYLGEMCGTSRGYLLQGQIVGLPHERLRLEIEENPFIIKMKEKFWQTGDYVCKMHGRDQYLYYFYMRDGLLWSTDIIDRYVRQKETEQKLPDKMHTPIENMVLIGERPLI